MQYYKGKLYTLFSAAVWGVSTTLQATIATFSTITNAVAATDFAIYRDVLYICTATSIGAYTTLGTLVSTVGSLLAGPFNPTPIFSTGSIYYVDNTNVLRNATTPAVSIMTNVIDLSGDGTSLYVVDGSNNLSRATVTGTVLGTLSTISTDIKYVCIPEQSITTPMSVLDQVYLPVLTRETPQMLALGSMPPFNFTYPNNLFTELMSYQMAVDFRVKAGQDPSMLVGRLGSRDEATNMSGLWLRMYQSLKRDDYSPNRISNRYSEQYSGIW